MWSSSNVGRSPAHEVDDPRSAFICSKPALHTWRSAAPHSNHFHERSTMFNRRQTLATDNTAIPAPATAARSRQSVAPAAGGSSKHGRPSSAQGSQSQAGSSQGYYNAPATVARSSNTYGAGSVALGWSAARGDAGNLRSSYAPTTR
jgi:hypothetical protein